METTLRRIGGSGEGGDGKRESWRKFEMEKGERTNIEDILKRNIDGVSDKIVNLTSMHQFAPVKEHIGEGDGREGKRNTKWPLLRGRLQGGGDPRVAYRGQAGERMWK